MWGTLFECENRHEEKVRGNTEKERGREKNRQRGRETSKEIIKDYY
jgi:hypothetical protein